MPSVALPVIQAERHIERVDYRLSCPGLALSLGSGHVGLIQSSKVRKSGSRRTSGNHKAAPAWRSRMVETSQIP